MQNQSLLHRSTNSARDFAQVSTYTQKKKQFRCRNSLCSTDQQTQEEILKPLFRSVYLHSSPVQSAISIQHIDNSPRSQTILYHEILATKKKGDNLDVGKVFASQIKKLGKRFCQVDQPLSQIISYTRLLYKAHYLLSKCRQSWFQNKSYILMMKPK